MLVYAGVASELFSLFLALKFSSRALIRQGPRMELSCGGLGSAGLIVVFVLIHRTSGPPSEIGHRFSDRNSILSELPVRLECHRRLCSYVESLLGTDEHYFGRNFIYSLSPLLVETSVQAFKMRPLTMENIL